MPTDASPLWVVFAKPPRPGLAKTRLAATLGAERAADVARAMLADTLGALVADGRRVVLSTPAIDDDHGLTGTAAAVPRWDQGGGELGLRLERAFARGFSEAARVIAVGADTPGLPRGLRDAVAHAPGPAIGPCDDGGFWALGLDACDVDGLLVGIPYGTDAACGSVVERLASRGHTVTRVGTWFDIDVHADLERFVTRVPRSDAPSTFAAVEAALGAKA